MRKLFVLLLVALVPVMIGCRLVENDDTGPDVVKYVPAVGNTVAITPTAVVPKALVAGALRGLLAPNDITLEIGGVTLHVATYSFDGTNYTLTFEPYTPTSVTFTNGTATLEGTLNLGGGEVVVSIPVTNTTSGETDKVVDYVATLTVVVDSTTNAVTVTVELKNTDTLVTSSGSTTQAATSTNIISNDFYVSSVHYLASTSGQIAATLTAAVSTDELPEIDDLTPVFHVNLASAATSTAPTGYTFTCENVTDKSTTTISSSDPTVVQIAYSDNTNKQIVFTVKKALEASKTYKVTWSKGKLTSASGLVLEQEIVRFFKTSAAAK